MDNIQLLDQPLQKIENILKRSIMIPTDAKYIREIIQSLLTFTYSNLINDQEVNKVDVPNTTNDTSNVIESSKCYETLFRIFTPSTIAKEQKLRRLDIFLAENPTKYTKARLLADKYLTAADFEMSLGIADNISNFVCHSI